MDHNASKLYRSAVGALLTIIAFFCIRLIQGQDALQRELGTHKEANISEIKDVKNRAEIVDARQVQMEGRLDRIQQGISTMQEDIKELLKRK